MPSPAQITRYSVQLPALNLGVITDTPTKITYTGFAGGLLFVDTLTGGSTYTITWYAAFTEGGSLVPVADTSGKALTTTVTAGKAYEIPGSLYGATQIAPILNSGSGTARATLKS